MSQRTNFNSNRIFELVRFAVVGSFTALIFWVLIWLFFEAGHSGFIVTSIAYSLAVLFQYLGHSMYTFRSDPKKLSQLLRFLAVNICGLCISIVLLDVLVPVLELPRLAMAAVVILVLPAFNFIVFKLWAFAGRAVVKEHK